MLHKIADRGPEWRAFDDEQRSKRTRVGAPLTYTIHDKGLSTTIDWHDRDIYGKSLSPGQKAQVYRLRKWQRRIRVSDATERNLAFALSEITKISNNLNLPKNILETASVIYRKAVKERLIRGRSIQGVTSAAIYLACRQCGLPRTLDEIAQASTVHKKEVGRSYRFLIKELNYSIPPLKPSQYITKFSNQLTMQGKVEEIAHKILGLCQRAQAYFWSWSNRYRCSCKLHCFCFDRRKKDAAGNSRNCTGHRSHHQEPIQGTRRKTNVPNKHLVENILPYFIF